MDYIRGRKARIIYNLIDKRRERQAAEYIRVITARKSKAK